MTQEFPRQETTFFLWSRDGVYVNPQTDVERETFQALRIDVKYKLADAKRWLPLHLRPLGYERIRISHVGGKVEVIDL